MDVREDLKEKFKEYVPFSALRNLINVAEVSPPETYRETVLVAAEGPGVQVVVPGY